MYITTGSLVLRNASKQLKSKQGCFRLRTSLSEAGLMRKSQYSTMLNRLHWSAYVLA